MKINFAPLLIMVLILASCQPNTTNPSQGDTVASSTEIIRGISSTTGLALNDQLRLMPASTLVCAGVSMNLQSITGPINVNDYLDQLARNNLIGISQIPSDQLLSFMRNCLFPHLKDYKI